MADLYPDPGDVRFGVAYGPNDNDFTGTLDLPSDDTVEFGINYGSTPDGGITWEFTGSLKVPGVGDVRAGVEVGPDIGGAIWATGVLVLPTVDQVLYEVGYGNPDGAGPGIPEFIGDYVPVAAGDVRASTIYGSASVGESTGTLVLPPDYGVITDYSYGTDGTEFTGTYVVVTENNVRAGVQFGVDGTEYTGKILLPAPNEVLDNVPFGDPDGQGVGMSEFVGYVALPTVDDVIEGVEFGGYVDSDPVNPREYVGTYEEPLASSYLSPDTYGPNGSLVGTYDRPLPGDVRKDVTFGDGGGEVGTLELPEVGDVRDGVEYGADGTEFGGTLVLPADSDVREGIGYGVLDAGGPGIPEFTGTLVLPGETEVLAGIGFGTVSGVDPDFTYEFTGSLAVPEVGDVREGVEYGDSTGTLVLPLASDVRDAVQYGTDGTEFTGVVVLPADLDVLADVGYGQPDAGGPGIWEAVGRLTLPDVDDVEFGVQYGVRTDDGFGGWTYELVGTVVLPADTDVTETIQYGAGGNEFTGNVRNPSPGDVVEGTAYGFTTDGGVTYQLTGTFVVPVAGDVRDGVTYGDPAAGDGDDPEFTGNLVLPGPGEVKEGVDYGAFIDPGYEITGTLVLPPVGHVLEGEGYGNPEHAGPGMPEFVGTLRLPAENEVQEGVGFGEVTGVAPETFEFTGSFDPNYPDLGAVVGGYVFGPANEFTGTMVQPNVVDVREATEYGYEPGTGATYVGVLELPLAVHVREGQTYGYPAVDPDPAEFTGTLVLPTATDVRKDVQYDDVANTPTIGLLVLPDVGDVRLATPFDEVGGDSQQVGTLVLPAVGEVDSDTSYGTDGTEFTGTILQPDPARVADDTSYGAGGTEFTGTLDTELIDTLNEIKERTDRIPDSPANEDSVLSIQNNTRCVRSVPAVMVIPESGTNTYRIELLLYDEVGGMEAPASAPTVAVANQAGTSRNGNLDATTMTFVSTGRYYVIYTVNGSHAEEQLNWVFSVTENAQTRVYSNTTTVTPRSSGEGGGGGDCDLTVTNEKIDAVATELTIVHSAVDGIDHIVNEINNKQLEGDGSVPVDHNYGGANNLSYLRDNGSGIDNAVVQAFLKTDYDAGRRDWAYVQGETRTNVYGQWVHSMKLDPATYSFIFFKQGYSGPDRKNVVVS